MEERIIRVEHLTKKYQHFTAIAGISFEVFRGEIFGLLGPNGAGKTTTLEIIETLRKKTSGEVTVCGYNIDTHPQEIKKIIGVQLQAAGYYPNLNLVQIIELFAGLYNQTINPSEILKKVNLEDRGKSRFKDLSGGQKQRFSIATTLVNQPEIIFLDEPTTGLDPQSRRNLWELIRELKRQGTTIVLTTHYMEEAEMLCDRVAIMDSGKIISLNEPGKLIDELLFTGFRPVKKVREASLEDVFIQLTGKEWREE